MTSKRQTRRQNLERLLRPRHIAVVGGRLLAEAVSVCRQYGFSGPVWPVSRSSQFVDGERCFESIESLPEGPDATLVLSSPQATNATVAALARHGAGGVVCYASGYGESGVQGQVLQKALVQAAGELAVVGPNCNGLANFLDKLVLWPNAELPDPKSASGVAVIAQSGAFLVNLCNIERALPVVFAAGIGNQAVTDVADLIEVLIDDERITAIGLYLESVSDTDALAHAAYWAAQREIPIIVLKSGRTPVGQAAAATHTGALLGSDELASAFFDRFAMQRVTRVSEFVETLKCVSNRRGTVGNRLAAITMSGGIATLVADAATRAGLTLSTHPPARCESIARHLPAYLSVANPLDCSPPLSAASGLSMTNQPALEDCFAEVASGEHDLVALFIDFPLAHMNQHYLWEPAARAFASVAQRIDKLFAVVSMLPDGLPGQVRDQLRQASVVPLQGLDDAMEALGALATGRRRRAALIAQNIAELLPTSPPKGGCTILLDEVSSKRRLAQAGLPIVEGAAATAKDAPAVAKRLGYPVVVKAVSEILAHKTKHGGVVLNVSDAASLSVAVKTIANSVHHSTGLDVRVFLVESMISEHAAEIFVGIKHDMVWGPCMVLGAGGIDVEDADDHVVVVLPAGEKDIERAVRQCRAGRRLTRLGVPLGRLEETLVRVAFCVTADASRIVELDINPLFVLPDGEVMVIDALLRIEKDEDGERT